MSRQRWPANSEDIYYPQCSNVFTQVGNICFTGSLRMGAGTIFKVEGTSARQKNYNILWFELATVTSQALKYDVINFCQHVWAILFKIW